MSSIFLLTLQTFFAIIYLWIGGDEVKDRLKEIRKALSVTQQEFADELEVSRNFIAQIEMGIKVPSERTIKDICRIFNVNYDWLTVGTGEMFKPISKDDEISMLFGKVLKGTDDNFRRRFVRALARLDEDGWKHLENLIDDISSKN